MRPIFIIVLLALSNCVIAAEETNEETSDSTTIENSDNSYFVKSYGKYNPCDKAFDIVEINNQIIKIPLPCKIDDPIEDPSDVRNPADIADPFDAISEPMESINNEQSY
jgi:hypothetical protein